MLRGPSRPRALLLLAVVATAFFATASRWVLGGDNAEFVLLGHEGGVAHPSGYPLYVMWLRAFAWLPAASAAHRTALATCLLGVGCVAMFERGLAAWGVREAPRYVAVGLFALSPSAWIHFTHAEVFALHMLLTAALLWLCAPKAPLSPEGRAVAIAAVVGLAASNNHTFALLAPMALVGFVQSVRATSNKARAVALSTLAFAACLAPYAYLLAAARAPAGRWVWGDTSTWRAVVHHFMRLEYGKPDPPGDPIHQQWVMFEHVASELLFVPIAIALYGLFRLRVRARASSPTSSAAAADGLVGALFLSGPVFAILFNVPEQGTGVAVIERFHLMPTMLVCVLVAVGIDELAERASKPALVLGALATLLVASAGRSFLAVRDHHRPTIERYLTDTLKSMPQGAILFGSGDVRLFGYLYAQRVLGVRPDVVCVAPAMWSRPWYRARIEERLGVRFDASETVDGAPKFDPGEVIATMQRAGRVVFTNDATDLFAVVLAVFPSMPVGTAIKLGPPGTPPPPLAIVERENERVFSSFDPAAARPGDDPWARLVYEDYARPWIFLANTYAKQGNAEAAKRCRARAAEWAAR